ncbi:MAG: hypothetical protein AB7L41_00550, partial [Flavobacteriaceae bacterium]
DRFNLACGRKIRAWAQLELVLFFFFQSLMGAEHFRCRTAWMKLHTFRARKDMIRALASVFLAKSDLSKLDNFLERATKLSAKRNLVAHASGGVAAGTGRPMFMSDIADKEMGVDFQGTRNFTWANIEGWPEAIWQLQQDMGNWMEDFAAAIEAQPKVHRPSPAE